MRRTWARGVIVVAGLLALWPLLLNGLPTFDDKIAIIENTSRWNLFGFDKGAFEPLAWLILALIQAAAGVTPWVFHAASLAAHLFNAVLVFALARRLFARDKNAELAAAAAGLLFCVHPLQVQAVAQAASLGDLLAVTFGLTAVIFHIDGRRPRWVLAAFVASALCHWQAAPLPLILLLLDARILKRRLALKEKLPLFLAAGALVFITLGLKSGYESGHEHALRPLNLVHGAAYFLRKTLWPFGLTSIRFLFGSLASGEWNFFICAGVVTAATAVAALSRRALTAWACWLLLLAPTHMLLIDGNFYVVPRFAYFAHAAFCLLAAALVFRARAAALAPLALIPLAWRQAHVWRDPLSILAHDLSVDPKHGAFFLKTPQARAELGAQLMQTGYTTTAEGQLRLALEGDDGIAAAHNNLGALLASQGKIGEAAEHFEAAVRLDPTLPGALENLRRARGR